jgi:integrase
MHPRQGTSTPCLGVERNKERPRRTILHPVDIPSRGRAIDAYPDQVARALLWMCLCAGARRGELQALTWDRVVLDVKRRRGEIALALTKNGEPHAVPLSAEAVRVSKALPRRQSTNATAPDRSGCKARVTAGKAWGQIRDAASLPDLRIHDLRRSVGSWLGASGCTAETIGALLNHKSDVTSKVYVQLDELDARRALVDRGASILRTARGRPGRPMLLARPAIAPERVARPVIARGGAAGRGVSRWRDWASASAAQPCEFGGR